VKYEYQDLSPAQFEVLVIFANQHLLGISVQGFADGADGGRDAKFVGTAEIHPSKAKPWTGTTIIQAKHTNGYNKHFLETDFFNPSEKEPLSVLGKEVVRIKRLRDEQQLDNYMLFANRRLTGGAESKIRSYISKKTGVPESSILHLWNRTVGNYPRDFSGDRVESQHRPDRLAVDCKFGTARGCYSSAR
jgi:hypothetical protein